MKIKELINILKKHKPNEEVYVVNYEFCEWDILEKSHIKISKDKPKW